MNSSTSKAKTAFISTAIRIKDFCKRHITLFYVIISLLLALLLISLLSVSVVHTSQQLALSSQTQGITSYDGYTVTPDAGGTRYTPVESDPCIYLYTNSNVKFNTLTLHFASEIKEEAVAKLFFSYTSEEFADVNCVSASISKGEKSVSFALPSDDGYPYFKINIDEEFTLSDISYDTTELVELKRTGNPVAIISLVIVLALLCITEKRFGYFGFIKSIIKRCYESTKALFIDKAIFKLIIRALFILSIATLAVSYMIILMGAFISNGLIVYMFVLTAITIILFITDRILSNGASAPIMFLVITVLCGFMMASLLPIAVSNSWDEEFHFARSVDMKLLFFNNEVSDADIWQKDRKFPLTTDRYINESDNMLLEIIMKDQEAYTAKTPLSSLLFYKFLGHIPAGFAMFGADLFNLNYFAAFIIAKMANVLTYALVIYLGLKKLKSGAYILSAICLLPTALFLASTFSYDYFVTAFICYSLSYFISELQRPDKPLERKDCIFMLGAFALGCCPKAIYFALLIPMLFMPKEKFRSKKEIKNYRIACLIVMLVLLATFLLPFAFESGAHSDLRGGSDVNSIEQIKFILTHPFKYAKILLSFLGDYVSLINSTTMSASFSYVGNPRAFWGTLSLCILAFCAFTDKSAHDDFKGSLKIKSISILTSFASIALVATALYVSFTPVEALTIGGCQWRYIIPPLLLFSYSIGSSKIRHTIDARVMSGIVFGFISLSILASFYDVYIAKIISVL